VLDDLVQLHEVHTHNLVEGEVCDVRIVHGLEIFSKLSNHVMPRCDLLSLSSIALVVVVDFDERDFLLELGS